MKPRGSKLNMTTCLGFESKGTGYHLISPWLVVLGMNYYIVTPPKINMEPGNDGFQYESPFSRVHFQVPCLFWGVYMGIMTHKP